MNRDDLEKLLGGYATGTLTPEERDALYAAALDDQQLFDALAREESLREVLQNPIAKNRLLAALEVREVPWHKRWFAGRLRPAVLAAALAGIAIVAVVMERRSPRPSESQPVTVAQALKVERPEPVPSLLPQTLEKRELPARAVREGKPADSLTVLDKTARALAAPSPVPLPEAPAPLAAQAEQVAVTPPPPDVAAPQAVRARREQPLFGQVLGGGGGGIPLLDARALFYFTPLQPGLQPSLQTNFASPDTQGLAATRAVTRAVADAGAAPVANLGIRYTVVQREATGAVTELIPGDLMVRLEANDAGYLYVFDRGPGSSWNLLASDRVARRLPYTIPQTGVLKFDDSGVKELFVLFSRQPQNPEDRALAPGTDQRMSDSPGERATYVVSTGSDPNAQKIAFPITVRRK